MSTKTLAGLWRRPLGAGIYVVLILISLLLAALTLAWPATPSYDPWSWLIWGRQLLHGGLDLAGGPSWKPLPVLFTFVFALFRGYQPDLWLIVARAALILSVLMLFRLTFRLTWDLQPEVRGRDGEIDERATAWPGAAAVLRDRCWRWLPPVFAGLMASIGFLLTGPTLFETAIGYSEALAVAAVLIGFELAYDGRHRAALTVVAIAALDRPEILPFWGLYALYLMWKDPGARALAVGLFVLIVLLWFVPQKLSSATLAGSINRAAFVNPGTPGTKACPFCAEMNEYAGPMNAVQITIAAGTAGVIALGLLLSNLFPKLGLPALSTRRRRALTLLCLAGTCGGLWLLLIALDVQFGLSGGQRYMMVGSSLIYLVGSAGFGWAALELSALGAARGRNRAAQVVLASITCIAMLLFVPKWIGHRMIKFRETRLGLEYQANLRIDLANVIGQAGGRDALVSCGTIMAEHFQMPMVAWYLKVPISTIQDTPGEWKIWDSPRPVLPNGYPNVIVRTSATATSKRGPGLVNIAIWEHQGARYTVYHDNRVTLYKDCEPLKGAA